MTVPLEHAICNDGGDLSLTATWGQHTLIKLGPTTAVAAAVALFVLSRPHRLTGFFVAQICSNPVPKLSETVDHFITSVQPFLATAEEKKTKTAAEHLVSNSSWEQARLHLYALAKRDWEKDLLERKRYFLPRQPIHASSRYYTDAIVPRSFCDQDSPQIVRAASVVFELITIASEEKFVPPFGSYQVPNKGCDQMSHNPDSEHILVLCNGNEYVLPVRNSDGECFSLGKIYSDLLIVEKHAQENTGLSIGILSSQNRDEWATHRSTLWDGNPESMKSRETALFALSLEATEGDIARVALQSRLDRLFDMPNVIIGKNGAFCALVPHVHATMDTESIFDDMITNEEARLDDGKMQTPEIVNTQFEAKPLEFLLAIDEKTEINTLKEVSTPKIDLHVEQLDNFPKKDLDDLGVDPGSFISVAIMKSVRDIFGKDLFTRESDTHSFTEEVKAFLDGPTKKSLIKAVGSHEEVVSRDGCDSLLIGLEEMRPDHPFFRTPGAKLEVKSSISQTNCDRSNGGGFKPTAKDGISVSFDFKENSITFHITTFENESPQSSSFGEKLIANVTSLKEMLEG